MTKNVRIENADLADYKVIVEVWDKGYPAGNPDTLSKTVRLDCPTFMMTEYLTSTRYFVVKEEGLSDYLYTEKPKASL